MGKTRTMQVVLDERAAARLERLAEQRDVSAEDLVRAYLEDWLDAEEHPLSRRGIYREYATTLEERLKPTQSNG